jgi:hypothetical protein
MEMQPGVSIEPFYVTDARLIVQYNALRFPGRWEGHGCHAAGLTPRCEVTADELADLVTAFGAWDIRCASGDELTTRFDNTEDEDERTRLRWRCTRTAILTLESLEKRRVTPGHQDIGAAWVIAMFYEDNDDQTMQPRPHVHAIVLNGTPTEIASRRRTQLLQCRTPSASGRADRGHALMSAPDQPGPGAVVA